VGDEGVVLTDGEREALAGLAEAIGDPWLAKQLAGQEAPPPRRSWVTKFVAALRRVTNGWIGLFLFLAGAVVAVGTFVVSTLLSSLGMLMMGVGAWRLVLDHGDKVTLRWTARQTRAAGPLPPHRQPGAA
jgi:hypothetical protein